MALLRFVWIFCVCLVVINPTAPVHAGEAENRALLKVLTNASELIADAFAPSVFEKIQPARLAAAVASVRQQYGPITRVTGKDGRYVLWTRSYRIPTRMITDDSGKIVTLFFQVATSLTATFDDVTARLDRLPGNLAYLVTRNGEGLVARNADKSFAVGSAFKLGVLAALKKRIDIGKTKWTDVLTFEERHRALPTGILQDMVAGAPLTVHTLAALMMAHSDNSATNVLMEHVGRDAVAVELGTKLPLTTREFFVLKADRAKAARYAEADAPTRRALLIGTEKKTLPSLAEVHTLHQPGVEWYIPLTRLCQLADAVRELDVIQINAGLAEKNDWSSVAFKGGSEIGVLNYTTVVTNENGARFCVATTWNHAPQVSNSVLTEHHATMLAILSRSE